MEKRKGILGGSAEKFFDIIGEIIGFLTILLIILVFSNAKWGFLPENIATILITVQTYAIIATVGVVSLEFAAKRGWILFIIIAALVAAAIIITLLPGTMDNWINGMSGGAAIGALAA